MHAGEASGDILPTLSEVLDEVGLEVFQHLSPRDLANLSRSSKALRATASQVPLAFYLPVPKERKFLWHPVQRWRKAKQ